MKILGLRTDRAEDKRQLVKGQRVVLSRSKKDNKVNTTRVRVHRRTSPFWGDLPPRRGKIARTNLSSVDRGEVSTQRFPVSKRKRVTVHQSSIMEMQDHKLPAARRSTSSCRRTHLASEASRCPTREPWESTSIRFVRRAATRRVDPCVSLATMRSCSPSNRQDRGGYSWSSRSRPLGDTPHPHISNRSARLCSRELRRDSVCVAIVAICI